MVRKALYLLLLAGLGLSQQACMLNPTPEEACNFVQNGDQQRISWGSQVPVVMYIDSSVPAEYFGAIKEAAAQWNQSTGKEVLKIGGWADTQNKPAQDRANVIYFRQTWENDRANEQARTTVYWAGDRIYEADIRVNDRNFDFFVGPQKVKERVDFQSLMVHEFGHVLGLAHTHTPQSVMASSLPSATLRRELTSMDLASVKCEY